MSMHKFVGVLGLLAGNFRCPFIKSEMTYISALIGREKGKERSIQQRSVGNVLIPLVDLEVFYLGHLKNLYTIQYNTIPLSYIIDPVGGYIIGYILCGAMTSATPCLRLPSQLEYSATAH